MVHDAESCVQGKVVLTMYTDDLAVRLDTHVRRPHKENNRNMEISMKSFQEAVDGVIRFMQENSLPALPYLLTCSLFTFIDISWLCHPRYIDKGEQ